MPAFTNLAAAIHKKQPLHLDGQCPSHPVTLVTMNQSPTKLSSPPPHAPDSAFNILNSASPPNGVRYAVFIRMQGADAAHEAFHKKTWDDVFPAARNYAQKHSIRARHLIPTRNESKTTLAGKVR
jgi:hypothetical protein